MSKETLDRILNKWISRKLLVFFVACVGLFFSNKILIARVIITYFYILF